MKQKSKATLTVLALGIITLFVIPVWAKYQQRDKIGGHAENVTYTDSSRYYRITIPEKYGQAFYFILNGNENQVSVADYKALMPLIINQVLSQSEKFRIDDSIAQSKIKKPIPQKTDSTNKKP